MWVVRHRHTQAPAAFRRLCVETYRAVALMYAYRPAAFRRLCVETAYPYVSEILSYQPPLGGCVLKRLDSRHFEQICDQQPSGRCIEATWRRTNWISKHVLK